MDVDPHAAKHNAVYAGRTYYFCSAGCRSKFAAAPERYVAPTLRLRAPSTLAAAAMALSSVSVIGNALRLRRVSL